MARDRIQIYITPDERHVINDLCDRFAIPPGELIMRALMPYYEAFNPAFIKHPPTPVVRRRRRGPQKGKETA